MKFTKCMKTVFAGVMAFAVAATSVPVNLLAETQDAGTDAAATLDPVLHWNMSRGYRWNFKGCDRKRTQRYRKW